MMIKTVIVDDEQPICDEVAYLLKSYIDISVIGVFNNSLDALTFIIEQRPRLVILDIQMPGLNGLELAEKLSQIKHPPLIVFLTAYDNHALEAFNTLAVGYLTKPVNDIMFDKMIQKVRTLLLPAPSEPQPPINTDRLCVFNNNKIIPLASAEIILAYVKEKEVFVRTANHEYLASVTLQEFDNLFSRNGFLRVHRQYVINLKHIKEVIPWFHGSYLLRMNDDKQTEVPVSRNNLRTLKAAIGLK